MVRTLPLSAAIAALPFAIHATASNAEEKALPEIVVRAQAESPHTPAAAGDTARLLDWEPGVSTYGAGGVSNLPAIHGLADDRLRIKVDGMDLISACSNHMNPPMSYIDPHQVGSVKIVAGITPVSQGGDSVGGTILVDAPAPKFAASEQGILKEGNTGAYYRSNGNAMGAHLNLSAATEQLSVNYSGATTEAENYKAASAFHRAGPAATGRSFISGDVVGSSAYKSENNKLAFALKSDSHLTELKLGMQTIPYQGFPNQRMDMTRNDSRQFNLSDLGQFGWGSLETRAYHERTRHTMNFLDNKQFYTAGMPMDTEGINTGAVLKANVTLAADQILRVGGEYQRYRLNDWWSPAGGGMAPNAFININNGQRDRTALFAELETQWGPQWQTQFGLRGERVTMDTDTVQGYSNGATYLPVATAFNALDRKRTDHNLDLAAIARSTPEENRSVEFGYSRKTRSPSLYERYTWSTKSTMVLNMNNWVGDGNGYVGNPNLKPEVAHTLSATSAWNDSADKWSFKATPYYTYVQDYIDAVACPACAARTADGFRNLTLSNQSARLYGLDLSGELPLSSVSGWGDFSTKGVLSYSRGKNSDTQDNLYNIMPLNGRLALDQHKGNWTGTVEVQLVERKSRVSQVRREMVTGGYGLMNLRGSYRWQQMRVDFGVENLFNKAYAQPLGGAYVGQGSTMGTGVAWGTPVPGYARSFYVAGNMSF